MKSHNLLLLHDFNSSFDADTLTLLTEQVPESLCLSVKGSLDFNRWDLSFRVNKKLVALVAASSLLQKYFKTIRISNVYTGNIIFDEQSKEEFWQLLDSD